MMPKVEVCGNANRRQVRETGVPAMSAIPVSGGFRRAAATIKLSLR
jgi:hypothetical protein